MSDKDHTIVIVRRHGGHEEDHHGGAWKIAFADFMTAMMAFFLVLWIVNSTNKETKTVIARYFNPLKLEDMSRAKRGIREDKQSENDPASEAGGAVKAAGATPDEKLAKPGPAQTPAAASAAANAEKAAAASEASLIADPAAALNEIAAKAEAARAEPAASPNGFENPFKPAAAASRNQAAKGQGGVGKSGETTEEAKAQAASQAGAQAGGAVDKPTQAARRLAEDIVKLAREASGGQAIPNISVQATEEGVLISLTDDANFSMFGLGSAQPDARTVAVIGKIGAKLKSQAGTIVLRGHTDARPFRSAHYDNWRLSSMRAQMALYMLTRGGLAEGRIERVEGYGARKPRNAKDPLATENRRIEILLRPEKP